MNLAPGNLRSKGPTSPLAEDVQMLVDGGYLSYLRAAAPPGVEITVARGSKASDGKLPSRFQNGRWYGSPDWRHQSPKTEDVTDWMEWPGAGLCLVTGTVCAFDVDIKIATADRSFMSERARRLVDEILAIIASKTGLRTAELPKRTRENSTSCAVFVRMETPIPKKVIAFGNASATHKVELLAEGQQIVIAGTHDTGSRVRSTLPKTSLPELPLLTPEQLTDIFARIAAAAERAGFVIVERKKPVIDFGKGPFTPAQAVARAVMVRRAEWVPELLPCDPGNSDGEWRITSEQLERDLEEDLCIYRDGIFDHGTERAHPNPVSFIQEFGSIDAAGDITFGGCPRYGRRGKYEFAVIGENDAAICRPTEHQACAWLLRQLAGTRALNLPDGADWSASLAFMAAAVDLDWGALEAIHVRRFFGEIGNDGSLIEFAPERWSADDFRKNAHLVSAIRACDPERFSKLQFAWDLTGAATLATLEAALAEAAERAGTSIGLVEEAPVTQWAEPRDVFGDGDPRRLLDIPPDTLPVVLERWAKDTSARMGAPAAFAAGAAIATLSAAIGSKHRIQPKAFDTSWTEPAFLWLAIIEEPGGKKSPLISAATAPLSKLDAERAKEDGKAWAEWNERKSKRRARDEPGPGSEPRIRRHVVESFTMEALTNVLKSNTSGVLVRQDELTQLIGALDAYKTAKGSDRPLLLSLFDGREMRVDRSGKGLTYVECWGAGVVGGIQPRMIAKMANSLEADGLLQRFIPVLGDGSRHADQDRAPDAAAVAAYYSLIRGVAEAQPIFPEAVRLSAGAQEIWRGLASRLEALRALPLSDAWRGHLGKWPGFSSRLLLILHVAETWDGLVPVEMAPVSDTTATRAVRLVEWLLSHSIRFYEECVGIGEAGEDARWIAGHILSGGRREKITRRDIGQARHEFRGDQNRVARAMHYLDKMSWCLPETTERVDRFGPSRWEINPLVFDRFASRAETERARREAIRQDIDVAVAERRRIKGAV